MTSHSGAWRCSSCSRQCAKSAEYCPGCGQHWTVTAEGYTSRKGWQHGGQYQRPEKQQWPRSPRRRPSRARQPSGGQPTKGGGQQGPKGSAKGTGKAGKAEVSKPSVDMLPAAPSGASIALPKGGTAPSSSTGPSLEKTQLEALTGCLAAVKDTLPTEVRETLERLQLASSANNTKDMHRAVAAQATAKKQLIQVQNARASYLEAWNSYVSQVTQLLKKQVEEQAAQLESYDEAELQWSGALEQTTADLADLARLARNPASSRNEADEEEMDSEDMVIADIQTAKELEQRRESQLADSRQLVSMMESVQQAATRQLKQEGRDGSRTPRRKSREGEVTDLTKDEDAAKAKAEKAAAKPTPPA